MSVNKINQYFRIKKKEEGEIETLRSCRKKDYDYLCEYMVHLSGSNEWISHPRGCIDSRKSPLYKGSDRFNI
jgi:hypothetical protein